MLCELPDATVSYVEYGRGRPIVMLHGFSLDHASMVHTFEPRFAKRSGWRRIFDRAGHLLGGEQPQLWPALVDEWLDRVEEWCAAG